MPRMIGTKNAGAIRVGKIMNVPEGIANVMRLLNIAEDAPAEPPAAAPQPVRPQRGRYKRTDMQAEQHEANVALLRPKSAPVEPVVSTDDLGGDAA